MRSPKVGNHQDGLIQGFENVIKDPDSSHSSVLSYIVLFSSRHGYKMAAISQASMATASGRRRTNSSDTRICFQKPHLTEVGQIFFPKSNHFTEIEITMISLE